MITTVSLKDFGHRPARVIAMVRPEVPSWLGPTAAWSSDEPTEFADRNVVAISRYGRVVATFAPVSPAEVTAAAVEFDTSSVVTSRDLHFRGPSPYVRRAEEGERLVVTYEGVPIGLLGPASDLQQYLPPMPEAPSFDAATEYLGDEELASLSESDLVESGRELRA